MSQIDTAPAIGVSLDITIDGHRKVVFQTYVPQDVEASVLDALLLKLNTVADRSKAQYQLDAWQDKLRDDTKQLELFRKALAQVDEKARLDWEATGRKGAFKLDARQQAERHNSLSTVQRYEDEIAKDREHIEKYESILASKS